MAASRSPSALERLGFYRGRDGVADVRRSLDPTSRATSEERGWSGLTFDRAGPSGQVVTQASAMRVSTVHACVTIRSEDVARCTPRLYRVVGPEGRREQVTDHPVARLLKRPNRVQTWFEFSEMMTAALLLRRNAYAVILRNRRGEPTELIPINPDWVTPLEAVDGSLYYQVARAGNWLIAVLGGMPSAIPAEDVLHLRGLSFNALLGASTLGFARDAIGLALAQEELAASWAGNGSQPAGVLQTDEDTIDAEEAARIKREWQQLNGGSGRAGGTAVLTGGLKWQQLSMTSVDAQFLESRNFSVEDICRYFRVPPHKVGQLVRATNNNIAAQDQDYVNNTIMPDLERWEGRLGFTFDLDVEGLEVDLDESALLRADLTARMNQARTGVMSMLITPDEGRQLVEGKRSLVLPPKGGAAGELQSPANMAHAGSQSTGTQPDDAGRRGEADPVV